MEQLQQLALSAWTFQDAGAANGARPRRSSAINFRDMPDRTVTAIVVGFNHANALGRCFDSLFGSQELDALEVIYVDNASTDSSVAATSWHEQIIVLENEQNLGFASAVNQGLERATGRYCALVNPDTAIGPECLARLCGHLERDPGVGLVGPRLLNEEGKEQVSLAPYPSPAGLAFNWVGRGTSDPSRLWLVGAMVMAETALLRQLGGLDEGFFLYGEDMDLSYRVQRAGRAVRLDQSVHITHTGNPRWHPERLVRVYGAYMRFAHRHLGLQRAPLGLCLSALWLLRGSLAGVRPRGLRQGLSRIWSREREQPPAERFY